MKKNYFILHDEEQIEQVVAYVQHLCVKNSKQAWVLRLFAEEQDWAVVFAWLIDNHVITFKTRPPYRKFYDWIRLHQQWRCLPTNEKSITRTYENWCIEQRHPRIRMYLYDTLTKLFSGQVEHFSRLPIDFKTRIIVSK